MPRVECTIRQRRVASIGEPYHRTRVNGVRKRTHIWLAERALGKPLPKGAHVHHMNEDTHKALPVGLVICPNAAYHMLIHARMRALEACGNANWLCCRICKVYGDPVDMYVSIITKRTSNVPFATHPECSKAKQRGFYNARTC